MHLACQVALMIKNQPAKEESQEIWVWYLCWEYPLEKGMATHSNILAWRIPWKEEPEGLQSIELQSQTWLKRLSLHAWKLRTKQSKWSVHSWEIDHLGRSPSWNLCTEGRGKTWEDSTENLYTCYWSQSSVVLKSSAVKDCLCFPSRADLSGVLLCYGR